MERVTDENIKEFTKDELEVIAIFREFNSGYALAPSIVKNKDVTTKEYARVSEHLDEMPGVDVTTDWERTYKYDETLRSVLGKVSSSEEGIPSENIDYYLCATIPGMIGSEKVISKNNMKMSCAPKDAG